MYDFNLYLACGNKQHVEFCLICGAKNLLISFAYKETFSIAPLIKRHNCRVLIDSGAFTSWNLAQFKKKAGDPNWQKHLIDIDKYADFINEYKDFVFRSVNLDVIPGEQGIEPTMEDIKKAAEQGWQNYKYLKEKRGIDTIHVYHQGDPLEYLDRMLAECDYIGISPSNDYSTERKLNWLDLTFRYILKSNNPTIKTHGFGVTTRRLLERYPWYSVDSSTHSYTAGVGSILFPNNAVNSQTTHRLYVSDINQEDERHISNKPEEIQDYVNQYLKEKIGMTFNSMTSKIEKKQIQCPHCQKEFEADITNPAYKARNLANIIYYLDLEKEMQINGPTLAFMNQQTLI